MLKIKDDYFIQEDSRRSRQYFHFENITAITLHASEFNSQEEFDKWRINSKIWGAWKYEFAPKITILNHTEILGNILYEFEEFSKCESDYEDLIKAHAAYHKKVKNEKKEASIEDRCQWDSAECDQVIKGFLYGAEMQRKYCVGADCTALTCDGCKHVINSIDYASKMRNNK